MTGAVVVVVLMILILVVAIWGLALAVVAWTGGSLPGILTGLSTIFTLDTSFRPLLKIVGNFLFWSALSGSRTGNPLKL